MKRAGIFLLITLALAFAVLHQSRSRAQRQRTQIPPDRVAQTAELTPDQEVSTQQRINRYFHNDVVPKLKDCWRGVQGKGMVQFDYSFTKADTGRWMLDQVSTNSTSLRASETAKALACMEAAARGTSFAVTSDDTNRGSFSLHWSWPVPYPTNADALTNAMFAMRTKNGGGAKKIDCDGRGTPPGCYICDKDNCKKVCVGNDRCTLYSNSIPTCSSSGPCASGGPFGVSGGSRVIF